MAITLISTVTMGAGGAASIDFTSIPGTYTDLQLVLSTRSSGTQAGTRDFAYLAINGSTANISKRLLEGTGSSAASYSGNPDNQLGQVAGSAATASTFGSMSIYFPNYAGSTNKSFSIDNVYETNAAAAAQQLQANLWSVTSAITSLSITLLSGSHVQYSTASLYGITKGSSGGVTVA